MKRYLTALAAVALLAACTSQGTGSAGESADASAGSSAAASGAAGAAPTDASAACREAFAPIGEIGVSALSDLGDLAETTATVEQCESIADWSAGARAVLGRDVNPNAARLLLEIAAPIRRPATCRSARSLPPPDQSARRMGRHERPDDVPRAARLSARRGRPMSVAAASVRPQDGQVNHLHDERRPMTATALAMTPTTVTLRVIEGGAGRSEPTWWERRAMRRQIVGGCPDHWWSPTARRTAACTCDRF